MEYLSTLEHLSNRDVRIRLGLSCRSAAWFTGVSINTILLFEQAPQHRRPPTLKVCEEAYRLFREMLKRAPRFRKGGPDG